MDEAVTADGAIDFETPAGETLGLAGVIPCDPHYSSQPNNAALNPPPTRSVRRASSFVQTPIKRLVSSRAALDTSLQFLVAVLRINAF